MLFVKKGFSMAKFKKIILLGSLLLGMGSILPANIIFDMNGVLVTHSGSFWHIGPTKFFGFFNPVHIEDTFFDFLNSLVPYREGTPAAMHGDRRLPQIMCDFQSGLLTAQQIREIIGRKLNELAPAIDSQRKVKLLHAIANFIFTPEHFVKVIVPLKKGIKILKKCYQQKDKDGNRLHKIFIISNWDLESFLLLYENKKIRKFLDLCDGIVISARAGCIKPGFEIFEYAFDYFNIDPDLELTFFIDDEKCNIDAARSLNKKFLKCIHCHNFDFTSVDKTLKRIGIYSR